MNIEIDPIIMLHGALQEDDEDAIKALLDLQKDVDLDGMGFLHWAVELRARRGLALLLEGGFDVERRAEGVPEDHPSLRRGSEPVLSGLFAGRVAGRRRFRRYTPLMLAAERSDIEAVRLLVESGADLEAGDMQGKTALMKAAAAGSVKVITYLAEQEADIHASDLFGNQPIFSACLRGNEGPLTVLLRLGANMWHANQQAYTPFMAAAGHVGADLLSTIISDYGGTEERINQADLNGWTALFSAVSAGRLENLRLLVERAGNTQARTERGESLLIMAAAAGHLPVVSYLVEERLVDLPTKDISGRNALYHAVQQGHREIVACLEGAGCVHERGMHGLDARMLSRQRTINANTILSYKMSST